MSQNDPKTTSLMTSLKVKETRLNFDKHCCHL